MQNKEELGRSREEVELLGNRLRESISMMDGEKQFPEDFSGEPVTRGMLQQP
jgi:hypothetical protein